MKNKQRKKKKNKAAATTTTTKRTRLENKAAIIKTQTMHLYTVYVTSRLTQVDLMQEFRRVRIKNKPASY